MAKSKNMYDFMLRRFIRNGNNIPKNIMTNKLEILSKMKRGGDNTPLFTVSENVTGKQSKNKIEGECVW